MVQSNMTEMRDQEYPIDSFIMDYGTHTTTLPTPPRALRSSDQVLLSDHLAHWFDVAFGRAQIGSDRRVVASASRTPARRKTKAVQTAATTDTPPVGHRHPRRC